MVAVPATSLDRRAPKRVEHRPRRRLFASLSALVAVLSAFALAAALGATTGTGAADAATNTPSQLQTIFGSATPGLIAGADTSAVTLGTRFTARVSGWVAGVRFYKGSANTGQHVGYLWTTTGQTLAQVSFTNESRSGWQTATFAQPVAINASTPYVVGYHAPNGRYAADARYFAGRAKTSGDLTAPADGTFGSNGVYLYGSPAFPTKTWKSASYYVDVQFATARPTTTPPPTTGPPVTTAPPTTAAPTTGPPVTTTGPPVTTAPPTTRPPTTTTTRPPTTTTSPTTSPTTPPTTQPPTSGGYPSASNTGVPAGVNLRPATAAEYTINTPGTVISGVEWTTQCLTINVSNVTVRNSRIRTADRCSDAMVRLGYNNTSIVFDNVELDGVGSAAMAICCSGFTLTRANIHGFAHGVHINDDVTVQDSWIHDLAMQQGDHVDGIISNGDTRNVVIRHNTITNPFGQTSAIAMFDDFGCFTNVTIDDNVLGGAGYTVYAGAHCQPGTTQMRWTNNRFLRTYQWGPVTDCSAAVLWVGNVWNDSSQPVAC